MWFAAQHLRFTAGGTDVFHAGATITPKDLHIDATKRMEVTRSTQIREELDSGDYAFPPETDR